MHSKSAETPVVPPTVPVHRSSPKVHRKAAENDNTLPPTVPPKKKQSETIDYFEVPVSLPVMHTNVCHSCVIFQAYLS